MTPIRQPPGTRARLLISIIRGALTYAVLAIFGVPYAGLIALFVGRYE